MQKGSRWVRMGVVAWLRLKSFTRLALSPDASCSRLQHLLILLSVELAQATIPRAGILFLKQNVYTEESGIQHGDVRGV